MRAFRCIEGEVVGIAGLIGAGRTELLRSIFGLDRIKSGEVRDRGVCRARVARAAMGRESGIAQRRPKKRRIGGRSEHRGQSDDDAAGLAGESDDTGGAIAAMDSEAAAFAAARRGRR